MRKLLNKPWFVALLAIAALAAVWTSLAPYFGSPPAAPVVAEEPTDSSQNPAPAATSEDNSTPATASPIRQIAPAKVSRDPFAVAVSAQPKPDNTATEAAPAEPDIVETVRLGALWTQNGQTLVYLNDHVYRAGDSIGRMRIDSATVQGIWLSHPQGKDFLEVGKQFVLRIPSKTPSAKSSSQPTP